MARGCERQNSLEQRQLRPATEANLAHSHAVADVAGLQEALDRKVAKAGDTLSDALTMPGLTLFHADWSGELQLHRPGGRTLHFRADPSLNHLVIHRPKGAPYACIEPVSHVADGFNLHALGVGGTGTHMLAPGEILCGGFDISIDW
ncbi:MAG TPA: hypothetical protein VHG30_16245 [Microvirga sp.]|nr:hypothetical protein [Microvirga sp.]